MPIRVTGMNSGLDTENIIRDLVKAKSVKKDKLIKKQKTLGYQQEAWKNINSKIFSFYSNTLGEMRWSSAYAKKKTNVSDSSAADVITGSDAMNGTQTLEVTQIAKAAYLTGNKIKNGTEEVDGDTKLSDLVAGFGEESEATFKFAGQDITLSGSDSISSVVGKLKEANTKVNINFDNGNDRIFIGAKETGDDGNFDFTELSEDAKNVLGKLGLINVDAESGAVSKSNYIEGKNAIISLNGAEFESSKNTFEINGLTINAKKETDGPVTITTEDDYDGIYDMVKNFLKEYNSVMKEIGTLYNAEKLKDMEPLTEEEADELSEKEVEKWEEKLKASALRGDSTLGTLANMISSTMQKGIEVGGKTIYLANFGIGTSSYFETEAAERNMLHIDGDKDDVKTSGNADKLKTMIANNPEEVVSFFTQLSRNLYDEMTKSMSSIKDTRSVYKVYNDKQMQRDYDAYTSQIAKQEEMITRYEDKYYKQFSRMETALAKMQSKETAISGLLGG